MTTFEMSRQNLLKKTILESPLHLYFDEW